MHSASYDLQHATIRDTQRAPIHAVRIIDALLTPLELDELAEQLRRNLSARGEPLANIVIIQGYSKENDAPSRRPVFDLARSDGHV